MKLNENFVIHENAGVQVLISMDSNIFSGLIELNRTAYDIVEYLKNDTNIDEITDGIVNKYNIDRSVAKADIENILSKLRSVGAIDNI